MSTDNDDDDTVNHPKHYNMGDIETIDFIDQVCAHYPGAEAASISSVIRYLSRAPHKGNKLRDLKKAWWYISHAIELVESKRPVTNITSQTEEEALSDSYYTYEHPREPSLDQLRVKSKRKPARKRATRKRVKHANEV